MMHLFSGLDVDRSSPGSLAEPSLRFSPTAWAKLLCWRDMQPCQVGAWGTSLGIAPLFVDDVHLTRQVSSPLGVTIEHPCGTSGDDPSVVGDPFPPSATARVPPPLRRIWIQLQVESSSQPSAADERTFRQALGDVEWGVLCILSRHDVPYARLQFFGSPGGTCLLQVGLQFGRPFAGTDYAAWENEYLTNVTLRRPFRLPESPVDSSTPR